DMRERTTFHSVFCLYHNCLQDFFWWCLFFQCRLQGNFHRFYESFPYPSFVRRSRRIEPPYNPLSGHLLLYFSLVQFSERAFHFSACSLEFGPLVREYLNWIS